MCSIGRILLKDINGFFFRWNSTVQMLVASYEAYEDLMKKSQEGKEFYEDLETKSSRLLERAKTVCKARKEERQAIMER